MQIETIDQAAAELSRAAFTAETATLEAAASFLAKRLVERRNTIPILSHIRIEASPAGEVTLTGSDLDSWASVTVPAIVTSPGAVCVDAGPFADALAKLRKGKAWELRFVDLGDHRAKVSAGGSRGTFNLRTLPVDDFPLPPTGELDAAAPLSRFTVPAARFLADLAALAPCQSTEETRYYLNGIALQVRDLAGRDRLTMAATDGHNIGAASRELPAGAETLPDTILSRKAVALLGNAAKLASDAEAMAIELEPNRTSGGLFRFDLGPVSIWTKAIDGTFPDWTKCFDGDQLTPTDEAEAPLFPELIPGTPLAAMAKLGKGAAIEWQDATSGKFGTVPGDDGLLFGALNLRADIAEPLKGYRYSHEQGDYAAREYLTGLAVKRHGAIPHDWNAGLVTDASGYQGLTIGKTEYIAGHYVETPNWETLAIERVYIEGRSEWLEGAYSVVMPRERAERRSDVTLEIDGDQSVYPIAVNSGGKIHLTADQVRNIAGESCFETLAVPIPENHPLYRVFRGHPAFVARWCYDQGDTRLLVVSKTGRCFDPKKYARHYLLRSEIEALIAGTWQPGDECATPEPMRFGEPEAAMLESPEAEPVEICPQEPQESESEPCQVAECGEAVEALSGPEIEPVEPVTIAEQLPEPEAADPIAELADRVAAIEARLAAPLSGESGPAPTVERAKRTAAHERAIRRAWAERKARREAERCRDALRADCHEWEALQHKTWTEAMAHKMGRRRAVTRALALRAALAAKRNAYTEAELQAAVAVERERAADLQRELVEAKASNAGVADGAGVAAAQAAAQMARAIEAEEGREALRAELDRERAALAAVTERNARLLQGMADLAERVERAEAAIAA